MRRVAMDLLARREHSGVELRRKLSAKGYDDALAERVVAELAGERLLDDGRFAEAYINARVEKGFGPRRIQVELRDKGVGDDIIAAALDMRDPEWAGRAAAARSKRFGPALPGPARELARQMRFLEYRGFTSDQIRRALKSDVWD